MSMTDVEQYLDDLVTEAGFEEDDDKEMILEDLEPLLYDRMLSVLPGHMEGDTRAHALSLIEKEEYDAFFVYCETMIPDFDDVMTDILETFKAEYLESFVE
jgi:hypothetical protein